MGGITTFESHPLTTHNASKTLTRIWVFDFQLGTTMRDPWVYEQDSHTLYPSLK